MITERIAHWLDERVGVAGSLRKGLNHIFPDHWSFMLGEVALYAFVVLVITGTYLAMFFNPSGADVVYHGSYKALDGVHMSAAYRSVLNLSFKVPAGLFVRQVHHWAALVFIGAIVLHMFRLYFTGAYRRPRDINWYIGLTLLILAMAAGFFGYSVPDDLLSGTGLRIAYSVILSIPFIGSWLAFMVFGGPVPNKAMISRMYILHVFVLPLCIAVLLGIHLMITWRQLHTNYPGPGRSDKTIVGTRLWPTYATKAISLFFLVFGVLCLIGGTLEINPIWIYGPFTAADGMSGAQPDWYLGWAEGALRLCPSFSLRIGNFYVPNVFFSGVLFCGAIVFGTLYMVPVLDRWFTGDRAEHHVLSPPLEHPIRTALGVAGATVALVLLFAGSDDVIAVVTGGSVVTIRTILRILFFAAPLFTGFMAYVTCTVWGIRRRSARE